MRKVLLIISFIAGIFIGLQGIDILTTSVRGESIYRMGMLIPAQDSSLYLYGAIFLVIGIILVTIPILIILKRKKEIRRKVL